MVSHEFPSYTLSSWMSPNPTNRKHDFPCDWRFSGSSPLHVIMLYHVLKDQRMLGRKGARKWDWRSPKMGGPEFQHNQNRPNAPTTPRCQGCQEAFTEVPEKATCGSAGANRKKLGHISKMLGQRPRVTEEILRTDYFAQGLPSPRGGRTLNYDPSGTTLTTRESSNFSCGGQNSI